MHITSLPGPHGNGDLGEHARKFVEFLADAGQRWWQMLPINPAGEGHSPYSGVSVFAGNPVMISLVDLADERLLSAEEVATRLPEGQVDYPRAIELRTRLLRAAFQRFRKVERQYAAELADFRERSAFWLSDYALFMALRGRQKDTHWTAWDPALAKREPKALKRAATELADDVAFYEFEQFIFDRQWTALRRHAAQHGVGLIGDVPIFVAHYSADVWSHPTYFELDPKGSPLAVAGVPPDYFSETGQRWGNPLYRWDALERDRFRWWTARFASLIARFDMIRLDHFIGFVRYWRVPAEEPTAIHGEWRPGPGAKLFDVAKEELGALPFIAEDLGDVTPEVRALRDQYELPGMRVLQFAFGNDVQASDFLPYAYPPRCVAYTGTHDNDTIVGWFNDPGGDGPRSAEQANLERRAAIAYLAGPRAERLAGDVHWEMIRAVFASSSEMAIIPMQDVLGLGNEARMNRPGEASGNWQWRMSAGALEPDLIECLREYSRVYGRLATAVSPAPDDPTDAK
jgi:4-alpha-glucanotransferase